MRARALSVCGALLLVACGGAAVESAAEPTTLHAPATNSAAFLLEVGANLADVLARPEATIEELDAARRAARGMERRRAERDLARAHLYAAEAGDERERATHLREVRELTQTSTRIRDEQLSADLDFLQLWASWRLGQRVAEGRAQRFVEHHESARDLVLMAWLVRGEIAFEGERWDDALEGFRAVLGHLGHPLYAFALFRSAAVWREQGREDDARQALTEVRDLGCAGDASAPTIHIAIAAARALGETTLTDPSGRERPASCPAEGAPSHGAVEDERPPILQ
ncbi:MAG: hypothetical protein U0234_19790 [Sandaracinus sp.]